MVGRFLHPLALVAAALALTGTAFAADDAKKPPALPRSFYQKFFTPQIASKLDGEISAATFFVDRAANPWTQDSGTIGRIEDRTIRATKGALKRYIIQSLQMDTWSQTVLGGRGSGIGTVQAGSSGARIRFGISHLAPRADILIPSSHGNVGLSIDVRGRVSTSFASHASNFSTSFSFDPPEHQGSFSLIRRF